MHLFPITLAALSAFRATRCGLVVGFFWLAIVQVSSTTRATQLAYEPFSYLTGSLSGKNGGIGFAGAWSSSSAQVGAGSLGVPGYSGVGNLALTSSEAHRDLATTYGADGTSIWVSWLNRVSSIQAYEGIVFSNSSSLFGGLHVGIVGGPSGIGPPSSTWAMDTAGGIGPVLSGVPLILDQTTLIVLHMSFLPGADRFDLYLNPALGSPPATPNATKTDLNLSFGTLYFSLGSATAMFDEIRVADSYANVVPTPEPNSLVLTTLGLLALLVRRNSRLRTTGIAGAC